MVFNTYHHTSTCLDEKIEIDEKNFQKFFPLPISLRVTLKLSLLSKKHFFVFCRKFSFKCEKSSNHYSQLKKQLKVDPGRRSYDFLTKTHEKILTIPNMHVLCITLENRMNIKKASQSQHMTQKSAKVLEVISFRHCIQFILLIKISKIHDVLFVKF